MVATAAILGSSSSDESSENKESGEHGQISNCIKRCRLN
jgi:hypothetical protein